MLNRKTNLLSLVKMPVNLKHNNVTVPALMVALDDFLRDAFLTMGLDVTKTRSYGFFKVINLWGFGGDPRQYLKNGLDEYGRTEMRYMISLQSYAHLIQEYAKANSAAPEAPETVAAYFVSKYYDWFLQIIDEAKKSLAARDNGVEYHFNPLTEDAETLEKVLDIVEAQMQQTLYDACCVIAYAYVVASYDTAEQRTSSFETIGGQLEGCTKKEAVDLLKKVYKKAA